MPSRRVVALVVLLTILAPVTAATVTLAQSVSGEVDGSPRLSVSSSTAAVDPGTQTRLSLTVLNDAAVFEGGPAQYEQRVTTARAVRLRILDDSVPLDVERESVLVGTVPEGTVPVEDLAMTVPDGTPAGVYRIPVRISYHYTREVDYGPEEIDYTTSRETSTSTVTVRVRERARFDVTRTASAAQVGDAGRVTVAVENVGSAPATDARVTLSSSTAAVGLGPDGRQNASTVYLGSLEPNETATANATVAVASDADRDRYALDARVAYDDEDGIARLSRPLVVGFRPAPEQSFAVRDVETSLRVGREGTVRARIVNERGTTVDSPVVSLSLADRDVVVSPERVALPTLAPGESARVEFDATVAADASAGTRQANFVVQYRNQRGELRTSDPLERRVVVASERERFAVSPVDATFAVDTDNRLTVRLRNRDGQAVRDVRLGLAPSPPLTSESSSAYVGRLGPNESTTTAFAVTVSEDAVPATVPVQFNVTAETTDGETVVAGPYVVPVTVVETGETDSTAVLVGGLVAVLLVLGGGWWWLRR
jgi:LPXTG-motif cell wall-anchored protein